MSKSQGPAAAWTEAFDRFGESAPQRVRGDFAVAARDRAGRVYLAVDRFAIRTLCYRLDGESIIFASRADALRDAGSPIDAQAIFDYLYFHVIPAPRTIFPSVHRVPSGHCAVFESGSSRMAQWWQPSFTPQRRNFAQLRGDFRALLEQAVRACVTQGQVGCFLSGGTDSSTVTGVLAAVTREPPETFSIGFDAEGYDEMAYARIAATHFKARHHEYYVTPSDLVKSIPDIAAACDQPFGNSSVVPAYYCARMAAAAGVDTLLAGDGGDELFGGNSRYARQQVFAAYSRVPQPLRRGLIEPLFARAGFMARVPVVRKAASYVEQARVPMPDRLQAYNLLARVGIDEILTPEFVARVDTRDPVARQQATYESCAGDALIDRMLQFDWKYTLADNDLRKVTTAASLAGIDVAFPLLDDRLVDFSMTLPSNYKVRRLKLRWFFKEALRGFLPREIIAKRKHGFGLPFGVWLTTHAGLRTLALGSLEQLRDGGIVRNEFLDRLAKDYLPRSPGYYGELIWILTMLAQWMAGHDSQLLADR